MGAHPCAREGCHEALLLPQEIRGLVILVIMRAPDQQQRTIRQGRANCARSSLAPSIMTSASAVARMMKLPE
jgi:hypothetical protein